MKSDLKKIAAEKSLLLNFCNFVSDPSENKN